jgi:protein-S-isoprenylcysteine O-methyltransferase Ste14
MFPLPAPTLLITISLLYTTYLTNLSITSPTPLQKTPNPHIRDRIGHLALRRYQLRRKIFLISLSIYHILLLTTHFSASLSSTSLANSTPKPAASAIASALCPHPNHLNPTLFTWNTYTLLCILAIASGAHLRLLSYSTLGRNFTFALSTPSELTTTGLYHYVQHPAYTGQILVLSANLALYFRWDGAAGCWISDSGMERLRGWGWCVWVVLAAIVLWVMGCRVKDEEKLLKERFGEEWEEWHRTTKRLVPGVF